MRKQKESKISFPKEEKNWISIIALIVAIFGGAPGIFVITNYFYTNRVVFGFNTDGIVYGLLPKKITEKQYIMLLGTVTNEGNKPLHPSHFELKIKIKDKWISLQKSTIPEDDVFNQFADETQNFEIKDAAKNDLQAWKRPITAEEPACGNLMFLSDELDIKSILDNSNKITFELTCGDIYKKEYSLITTYEYDTDYKARVKFTKHNISFGPKEKQK